MRRILSRLNRAEHFARFGAFATVALLLTPLALFRVGVEFGLDAFGAATLAGGGLAVGVRLIGWRRRAGRTSALR